MQELFPYLTLVLVIIVVILVLVIREKNSTIKYSEENFRKQLNRKEEIIALLRSDMSTLCTLVRKSISEASREEFGFYYDLYGAAEYEIPDDVFFINGYIPVKGTISEDTPFGDYTVYTSPRGHCYHSRKICSSQFNKAAHAFDVINTYSPCPKCAIRFPCNPPQWYLDIKRIMINNETTTKR